MCKWLRKLLNSFTRLFYHRSLAFYQVKTEYTGTSISYKLVKAFVKVLSRKTKENDPLNNLISLLEEKTKSMDAFSVARVSRRLNDLLYERWNEDEQWAKKYVWIMSRTFNEAREKGYGIAVH